MGRQNGLIQSFNRGLISKKGLARTDLPRYPLSAEVYDNCVPRVLGSMQLRTGLKYIGETLNSAAAVNIPFLFSFSDTAILEFTDSVMRVRVNEAIVSRPSVSSAVATGDFSADTDWVDNDETGATSTIAGGVLSLVGTRWTAAIRRQEVTVGAGDLNVEHALRITVDLGPVILKIGSTTGGSEYSGEQELKTGDHSLSFTPTANFHIELSGRSEYATKVSSCIVDATGDMKIITPWTESDLEFIRWDQSADVIYTACKDVKQKRIERRGTRSWSIVDYDANDGPFLDPNTATTRLTASGLSGDITITSDRDYFTSGNVGSLFKITSAGQKVEIALSGDNQWSDPIRITGVGSSQRTFYATVTGAFVGTVRTQRSIGSIGSWNDINLWTAPFTTGPIADTLDNQVVYYRIGIATGEYTSGTPDASLEYASGGLTGIVRVDTFTDAQNVGAHVLKNLGLAEATELWSEGAWSTRRGFPTAVALSDGRNWWGGQSKIWGSVSDAFSSYDDEVEGESGTIVRTLSGGSVDVINWILDAAKLTIGTSSGEYVATSSSLDEPLTPFNTGLKRPSTQGSASPPAVNVDGVSIFTQKSQIRLFELSHSLQQNDLISDDLGKLIPEIFISGIKRVAVQRQPDTRVHVVLNNGTTVILVVDRVEEVKCWVTFQTEEGAGIVEDVFVIPKVEEDYVYYQVKRTVNGATVRYLERFSFESECVGGTLNKQADSFIEYSGVSTTTITGLDHLEGKEVVVWGDGVDLSPHDDDWVQTTYTVTGGSITLATAVENAIIGLPYKGQYKTIKLTFAVRDTALTQVKKVSSLGLILEDAHPRGLRYGPSFDDLDPLPLVENGTSIDINAIYSSYDEEPVEFDGCWDTDSRVCLEMYAPRPCTVLAMIISMVTNEKR